MIWLGLVLIVAGSPEGEVVDLVARLADDDAWWEARRELREVAAEGRRVDVLRALHDTWLADQDATFRRRNELVRSEVDLDWCRAERQAELERRADAIVDALDAAEAGELDAPQALARLRELQTDLEIALETTPYAIASQGLLPFGPPGPAPAGPSRIGEDGEVTEIRSSDGTTFEAVWRDGRLVVEVDGFEVTLATPEEQATPEYKSHASARAARPGPRREFTVEQRAAAAAHALDFLVSTQEEDGGWPAPPSEIHDRIFDTAVAGLGLVAAGNTLEDGEHREAVRRVRDFLLARIPEDGPPRVDVGGHGTWVDFETWYLAFAGLFLAECSEAGDAAARAGFERVRRRLVRLARRTGGWHHDHDFRLAESGSYVFAHYSEDLVVVTNFVVPVLFGAGEAPEGADVRGVRAYYAKLQNTDGGFAYGNHHGWTPSRESEAGRTAGALGALATLGLAETAVYRSGRDYLAAHLDLIPTSPTHGGSRFPINYLSGAVGALQDAELWGAYRARYFGELLATQREDGAFLLDTGPWDTPVMGTGIALVTLLIEDRRLGLLTGL